MKKILLVISVFITTMCACWRNIETNGSQKKKTDAEEAKLYGGVKSVKEISYEATSGEFMQLTKGKINSVSLTKYNENGNIIESEMEYHWQTVDDVSFIKSIYKYDDKGNKIEIFTYDDGELERKETFKYDDKGNMIEICTYNSTDSLDRKSIYQYDDRGNMIEFHQDGGFNLNWFFKYDRKNNKIERVWNNADGSLRERVTFKYDDRGNMIEQCGYNSNGLASKWILKYDDKGYKTKVKITGVILNQENVYEYKYDFKGNWIEKTEYDKLSNTVTGITERIIGYLD